MSVESGGFLQIANCYAQFEFKCGTISSCVCCLPHIYIYIIQLFLVLQIWLRLNESLKIPYYIHLFLLVLTPWMNLKYPLNHDHDDLWKDRCLVKGSMCTKGLRGPFTPVSYMVVWNFNLCTCYLLSFSSQKFLTVWSACCGFLCCRPPPSSVRWPN